MIEVLAGFWQLLERYPHCDCRAFILRDLRSTAYSGVKRHVVFCAMGRV